MNYFEHRLLLRNSELSTVSQLEIELKTNFLLNLENHLIRV